jgi:hypothetical protein
MTTTRSASCSSATAHYGPFVMNTRVEIIQAIEDYRAGRLGVIPADQLVPRRYGTNALDAEQ